MENCWARSLGDCSDEISKEHLVSAGLWEGDGVDVIGFDWCRDGKRVGINSVVSKILCKKHNNALSPLDSAAKQAFQALRDFTAISNKRTTQRLRKWKVVRLEIQEPWLLERWFLKTAINLCIAKSPNYVWRETQTPMDQPPESLVRMAFGHEAVTKPRGLYVAGGIGTEIQFQDIVSLVPLTYDGPNLVSALFEFRGVRFVFHFEEHELPPMLNLSTPGESQWRSNNLLYHLKRMNGKVGKRLSHYVDFVWHLQPESGSDAI